MKKKLSEEEVLLNEQKKEYLKQYIQCLRSIARINELMDKIRIDIICPSAKNSDMPYMTNNLHDLSDYIVREDELANKMLQLRYKRIQTYTDIFERIEQLDDEDERAVLTYRYIHDCEWEEIAEKIHVSCRQVHRIHARALVHFQLPEEKLAHNDTQCCDILVS